MSTEEELRTGVPAIPVILGVPGKMAVLWKHWLNEESQKKLLQELASNAKSTPVGRGVKPYLSGDVSCVYRKEISEVSDDSDDETKEDSLSEMDLMIIKEIPKVIQSTMNVFHISDDPPLSSSLHRPSYIKCLKYSKDAKLMAHCDRCDGIVVLFSLGCTSLFTINVKQCMAEEPYCFAMQSGDCLIFDSSMEAGIIHSMDQVLTDTFHCAKLFSSELMSSIKDGTIIGDPRLHRYGLQLRCVKKGRPRKSRRSSLKISAKVKQLSGLLA